MATTEISTVLRELRLSGVLGSLEVRIDQAKERNASYEDFMLTLLTDEVERRRAKRLERRVKLARFEGEKSLNDFDFAFNPKLPKARIVELFTLGFIEQRNNVLLVGPTGVGKSHLAQALGQHACRKGYKVRFSDTAELLRDLRAQRAVGTYERHIQKLGQIDLLILDDVGLTHYLPEQAQDLYRLVKMRHEKKPTIITSNRALEEWGDLFEERLMLTAMLDRLLDRAVIIELDGRSFRAARRQKFENRIDKSSETKTEI